MKPQIAPDLSPVAEKIARVAGDLFYRCGYKATGINEVIKKAEVAKATFYHHFPTKDALYLACLKRRHKAEVWFLEGAIAAAKTPIDRFMAPMESRVKWLVDNDHRGCGFIYTAAEVPDPSSPPRQEGKMLYDYFAKRIEDVTEELIASDSKKYKRLQKDSLAQSYFLIFSGAVMLAGLYHDVCPLIEAGKEIKSMLNK